MFYDDKILFTFTFVQVFVKMANSRFHLSLVLMFLTCLAALAAGRPQHSLSAYDSSQVNGKNIFNRVNQEIQKYSLGSKTQIKSKNSKQ